MKGSSINVVIPMAGAGSRFAKAGYALPKPFIDVGGKPMIARVMDNLRISGARYILIARQEHLRANPNIVDALTKAYNATFIELGALTEGTACTVLFARRFIADDTPLLVANSDQLVDLNLQRFVEDCWTRDLDGSILTFTDLERNPKWSFAKVDDRGLVTEVREKVAISEHATVGIYLFRRGRDFVDASIDMIAANDRVNNEFYTCPVYNYLVRDRRRIGIFDIPPNAMHGLGTPEDLVAYLKARH